MRARGAVKRAEDRISPADGFLYSCKADGAVRRPPDNFHVKHRRLGFSAMDEQLAASADVVATRRRHYGGGDHQRNGNGDDGERRMLVQSSTTSSKLRHFFTSSCAHSCYLHSTC